MLWQHSIISECFTYVHVELVQAMVARGDFLTCCFGSESHVASTFWGGRSVRDSNCVLGWLR